MNAIFQLTLVNLKMLFRNLGGLFWTLVMPTGLYAALSVLPIPRFGAGQIAYKDFVLPGILAYSVMSSGIYGLAYWMTDMKARGVIKRFLVTPIKTRDLVAGLLVSRVLVMLMQTVLITAVGMLFFGARLTGSILGVVVLVLLGGGIFLLIGLLIANFSSSYESAAPLTAAVGMPFSFLGNIFFPISGLPEGLRIIAGVLPITYLADGLRKCFLDSASLLNLQKDIFFLLLWFIGLLLVTIKIFKLKE